MYLVKKYNNKSLLDEMNSLFGGSMLKPKDMKTDIEESKDAYNLEIEIPGFSKDEIAITYENGYLTISAYKNKEVEENKEYIRKERYTSSIQRTYFLGDIDEENIKAKLDNGVLNINAPKLTPLPENTKRIFIE